MFAVMFPSTLSTAVAPASVYVVVPTTSVTGVVPFKEMTGAMISGVPDTVTIELDVDDNPYWSVIVRFIV